MATNLVKVKEQTAIVWADTDDYVSTVSGFVRTHQFDFTSISAGAYHEGAKADLGLSRFEFYAMHVAVEFASGALSDETIKFYWGESNNATAGTHNPGGMDGVGGVYTGTAGDSAVDSAKQLFFVGSLTTTADQTTVVQYGMVGLIPGRLVLRWGMPLMLNGSTGATVADSVEQYIALVPVIPDIQAAV